MRQKNKEFYFLRSFLADTTYNSTAEAHGFDATNDDSDFEAIAILQGNDIDDIEVEPGETFVISEDFENGIIDCEETSYRLIKKDDFGKDIAIEGESQLILDPGKYQFHTDGLTIFLICVYA